jgi:predicted nucleic acid-binding Zn ribbon protein
MDKKKNNSNDFVHIGNILGDALTKFRSDSDLELAGVFAIWKKIVGEAVAKNCKPAGFKAKILIVHVSSPIWIQELQYYKKDMIMKINEALGKELVCDIKFRVGAV